MNGKQVLGRQTKWGLVEVENKKHCDFSYLRDMLIRYGGEGCRCVCVEGWKGTGVWGDAGECEGSGGVQVCMRGGRVQECVREWREQVCGEWRGAGVWRDRGFLYGDIVVMCLNILINPWIITANPCILL